MANHPDKIAAKSRRRNIEQRRSFLALVLTLTAVLFCAFGFWAGVALRKSPLWMHALVFPVFILTLRLVFLWSRRRIEGLDQEAAGAGEAAGRELLDNPLLRGLSGDFRVVNGLPAPSGHTECLVVGKTGIFLLDAVHW
jgi:hypothetical protein